MSEPRYAIGIDLGTTNCSLAYVDLSAAEPEVMLLPIPQWESEGQLQESVKLPSFVWLPSKSIVKQQSRRLPWQAADARPTVVLGREARLRAIQESDRVAYAAKSWLSVGASSTRTAKVLPWGSNVLLGEEKLSPLAVSILLLEHMRDAWNARFGVEAPFHEQSIVISVPASFDDLAQRLTLEAASRAGYPKDIELIEEPQAAFYDWYRLQERSRLRKSHLLLVCDIGGGTSDFTLLRIDAQGQVERLRVSEHLLLGGDNIDLALAAHLQGKMHRESGVELGRAAWQLLVAQARQLKEDILSGSQADDAELHVSVPLQAEALFGAYGRTTLRASEVKELIIEGFFPAVDRDAQPLKSQSGLRQFGLPFVQDTAVTRHLAAFLHGTEVDALLCAGGTLTAAFLQERLRAVVSGWQRSVPERLSHPDADLAIARGASWFAWQRRRGESLIASSYPRSLYITVSGERTRYLCLVPKGQLRGRISRLELPGLKLRVGQKVTFQLYSSLKAPVEEGLPLPDWKALPSLSLELPHAQRSTQQPKGGAAGSGELVPVALEAQIRETGVLEVACRSLDDPAQRWNLDFTIEGAERGSEAASYAASEAAEEASSSSAELRAAQELLKKSFAKNAENQNHIERLPRLLEDALGLDRENWSISLLRRLIEPLLEAMHRRQKSPATEATWLYLCGFCLRPGFGAARDPERIRQIWPLFDHGWNKAYPNDQRLENQWWLFWRRAAGGLNAQQQGRILDRILPIIRKNLSASPEILRLGALLERAPMEKRIQLGRLLAQQIASGQKEQLDARIWALARVSSRYPLAAGPEAIIPPHIVEEWADLLRELPLPSKHYLPLKLFYHFGGRLRGESALDIDPRYREHFLQRLEAAGADANALRQVRHYEARAASLDQQLFGESLPSGFLLSGET